MSIHSTESDIDALMAEYERLDGVLLEVIADMAVLRYRIDNLKEDNQI